MNDVKRPDSLEKSWRGKIRLQNRSQIRGVQRSVLDPNVWSGRALQEVLSSWRQRSCINVSGL
jgi:hypothetical protein